MARAQISKWSGELRSGRIPLLRTLPIPNPIRFAGRAERPLLMKVPAGPRDKLCERVDSSRYHLAPVVDRPGDLHLRLS